MININEIEVNGEKFGIESVTNLYINYKEPDTDVKPIYWYRTLPYYYPGSVYGMEMKAGSAIIKGDYTLDDNGQLVETTDTANNAPRATKMFTIFGDKQYKMYNRTAMTSSTLQYPFAVYFYNKDKEFISKSSFITELDVSYPAGIPILDITPPAGTRYVRCLVPYQYTTYIGLAYGDVSNDDLIKVAAGNTPYYTGYHMYDGDAYVKI